MGDETTVRQARKANTAESSAVGGQSSGTPPPRPERSPASAALNASKPQPPPPPPTMTGNTLPPDALDYFSETAAKLGTGGSTGVMIQSPDGRPAGIFFHPRTNSSSTAVSIASSSAGGSAARTPGIGTAAMMARRGSADDRLGVAAQSSRTGGGALTPSVPSPGPQPSGASSERASPNSHATANEAMTGLPTANGNMFSPTVGLQSIFSRQRPPTATPLRQSVDPHDNGGETMQKISLDALHEKGSPAMAVSELDAIDRSGRSGSREVVKGDKADRDDAEPRSPLDGADAIGTLPLRSTEDEGARERKRQSQPPSGGRQSFGTDMLSARQTFTSAVAPSAVVRPSAQPQSGLLIGAGFSQPRRKGGMGPKRSAQNIEVLPPIKVLIVEDNPINVKILSTFLKQRKIKYGVARDGREAVKEWEAGGYHLILMDIQLPVMDGIEATKEIRRLEQMANIAPVSATTPGGGGGGSGGDMVSRPGSGGDGTVSPYTMLQNSLRASVIIVALTASVLNSDRVAALAAGCNDFLNKPVDLRWLERKVIEWGSMQYLISFREWPGPDGRMSTRNRGAAAGVRRTYLSPTHGEVVRSDGLVDRAFNTGPDRLARELAGRLYIGGKKVKGEAAAVEGRASAAPVSTAADRSS